MYMYEEKNIELGLEKAQQSRALTILAEDVATHAVGFRPSLLFSGSNT